MNVFDIAGKFTVIRGSKAAEPKFRTAVSAQLIEKFGKGPFPTELIREILDFCKEFYVTEFEKVCAQENSYTFYKEIVWLNEQATELRRSEHFHALPEGLDKSYIAGYRRILKMVLEEGCRINMVSGEARDQRFFERMQPILNDLLYLGEMIYDFSESSAEQHMAEDISDISFDEHNLYVQSRRHHYEFIFEHIIAETEKIKDDFIIDKSALNDFQEAINVSFDIDYDKVKDVVALLFHHYELLPGACLSADQENFIRDLVNYTGAQKPALESFLAGLTLSRDNKMPILELIRRPNSINRFLYRPLLLWTINSKKFYVFGVHNWDEAENSLLLNAIPWGKFPTEWDLIAGLKGYVNKKKEEHDKWLDDVVEKIILDAGLMYHRGLRKLVTNEKSYPLEVKGLGEIDFLVICPAIKKILVIDCKHLQGRYGMVDWKNDYDHFIVDGKKKGYNSRIEGKVGWLTKNKKVVEEHFRRKYVDATLTLDDYTIEGVFVINTPTFYMYNSPFRIYTYHHLKEVVTGAYTDPTFSLVVDEDDNVLTYFVSYPYLRKPKLLYYEDEDDGGPVDKYGYPIKPAN
jgi:hypothetical protein